MFAPEILAVNWVGWELGTYSDCLDDFSDSVVVQEGVLFSTRQCYLYAGDLSTSFLSAQLQGVEAGVEELWHVAQQQVQYAHQAQSRC